MKRVVGLILLALGVMLLVLAPLLKFYVLPSAAKTPVDQYSESTADVNFRQILNPQKVAAGDKDPYDRDVAATQYIYVRGDVPAAEQPEAKSQDLAVFDYFMRVNNNDTGDLITASTARYAFDRVSSELVDCCGASVDDEPVNMAGSVMPVKWAFDLQKQDYQVFNTSIKGPSTWAYQGEENVFGINTYVYNTEIPPTKVNTLEVPTSAIPGEGKNAEGNTVLDEMYSVKSTYWMDPVTGQVVKGESSEFTTYDLDGELPVNPDGGLKSFGHPIGASGLRMLFEAWLQLRGEAPPERQIKTNKTLALTHNLGGQPGACVSFISIWGTELG